MEEIQMMSGKKEFAPEAKTPGAKKDCDYLYDTSISENLKNVKYKISNLIFAARLRKLIIKSPKTSHEIEKEIGFSRGALYCYCSNLIEPDLEEAVKLANYFNVSLDWLCGREN